MKIIIVGDSHTGPLNRGLQSLQSEQKFQGVKVAPIGAGALMNERFFEEREGFVEITVTDAISSIKRLPYGEEFDWYGVSGPLHVQPIVLDPFFYGNTPQPVTNALLKRLVLDRKQHSLAFMAVLKKLGLNVFVVEAPRTFPHHPGLPRDLSRVSRMEERCRAIIMDRLAEMGIPLIALPPEALDANGMMKAEFRHESESDKHHANAAFGAMMIEKTLESLSGARGVANA